MDWVEIIKLLTAVVGAAVVLLVVVAFVGGPGALSELGPRVVGIACLAAVVVALVHVDKAMVASRPQEPEPVTYEELAGEFCGPASIADVRPMNPADDSWRQRYFVRCQGGRSTFVPAVADPRR